MRLTSHIYHRYQLLQVIFIKTHTHTHYVYLRIDKIEADAFSEIIYV